MTPQDPPTTSNPTASARFSQSAAATVQAGRAADKNRPYPRPSLMEGMNEMPQQTFQFAGKKEASHYEKPLITVDVVIFSIIDDKLSVLLLERPSEPFQGQFSIPGGFMNVGEGLEEAAQRWLLQKTGAHDIYLEQLAAFGGVQRDPRARVITISYYALVCQADLLKAGISQASHWYAVDELPGLAFDHADIIQQALARLKERVLTFHVLFELLSEKFTLTQLQRVYETILNCTMDKRNFRKKIVASGLLVECTGETKMDGFHRPAQLYRYSGKQGVSLL